MDISFIDSPQNIYRHILFLTQIHFFQICNDLPPVKRRSPEADQHQPD